MIEEVLASTHVAHTTHNCIDVAQDAVWIGKDYLTPCVNVDLCKREGCYWRLFHALKPEQFSQPDHVRDLQVQGDFFDE